MHFYIFVNHEDFHLSRRHGAVPAFNLFKSQPDPDLAQEWTQLVHQYAATGKKKLPPILETGVISMSKPDWNQCKAPKASLVRMEFEAPERDLPAFVDLTTLSKNNRMWRDAKNIHQSVHTGYIFANDIPMEYMVSFRYGSSDADPEVPTAFSPAIDLMEEVQREYKRFLSLNEEEQLTYGVRADEATKSDILHRLDDMDVYVVASEVCELIDLATAEHKRPYHLSADWVPSTNAFVYFSEPFWVPGIKEEDAIDVHGLSWTDLGRAPGLLITFITGENGEERRGITRHLTWEFDSDVITTFQAYPEDHTPGIQKYIDTFLAPILRSFFAFINQTITVYKTRPLTRAMRRQLARKSRAQVKLQEKLQVIRLRKVETKYTEEQPERGDGETASREYSHRWINHRHWRNQPYGPGRTLRRPTLIDDYVKGPADKPLWIRPSRRIFNVDR